MPLPTRPVDLSAAFDTEYEVLTNHKNNPLVLWRLQRKIGRTATSSLTLTKECKNLKKRLKIWKMILKHWTIRGSRKDQLWTYSTSARLWQEVTRQTTEMQRSSLLQTHVQCQACGRQFSEIRVRDYLWHGEVFSFCSEWQHSCKCTGVADDIVQLECGWCSWEKYTVWHKGWPGMAEELYTSPTKPTPCFGNQNFA